MRLPELIRDRKESILEDFEKFARTHTAPGVSMDLAALRDHASAMLDEFAREMEQPQTGAEQERKAWGDAPEDGGEATAADMRSQVGRERLTFGDPRREPAMEAGQSVARDHGRAPA